MESSLLNYTLQLADNALILGHRNSEWCGHGPVLEQDIAITNISLDLIGQARNFYQYAADLINQSTNQPVSQSTNQTVNQSTEDTLAYLRDAHEFKNCLLTELPKGDWAVTIARQFFFSAYQFYLYNQLKESNPDGHRDEQIAAIAVKSLKEVVYHLRWSSEWVIRLGDGTEESHKRMVKAIEELWPYTGEFFIASGYEGDNGVNLQSIKDQWMKKINDVFLEATLSVPKDGVMHRGGKEGKHSAHLDQILSELQLMQRTYPNSEW